ncbi:MAG: hypothetical protein KGI73_00895 [Patescibacteria group bacterium]|nr:hypothetical protein [Patescibacteria group bacterium]
MKTSYIVTGLVAVVLIIGGVWYFSSSNSGNESGEYGNPAATQNINLAPTTGATETSGAGSQATPATQGPGAAAPQTVTVTYDGSSFSPSTINIHTGDTVTFVDSSSNPMWVASGVHPTHTVYDGTDRSTHCATGYTGPTPFDECQASTASYSFTFTKTGTWPFHNHVNPSATGKVVVE